MASQDNDHRFCWERVNESNTLFRISHLFAPDQFSDQILALYALFASIDQVSHLVSEEQVARRKLEWWRCELKPKNLAESRHPVVRYLKNSGATDFFPAQAVEALFSAADARLDMRPPSDLQEFRSLCSLIYQPRIHLECAVCSGLGVEIPDFRMASVNGGLLELLRESCGRPERTFWWVPLNLLAHFSISRRELGQNLNSQSAQALFRAIFEENEQLKTEEAEPVSIISPLVPGQMHVLLMAALKSRQIDRLAIERPGSYAAEMARWRVSDVFAAWKLRRKLNETIATD